MTTKHEVIQLQKSHPDWTSAQIADALGCHSAYVRATCRRNNLTLPKSKGRRFANSLEELGRAARRAGLTVADIEALGTSR